MPAKVEPFNHQKEAFNFAMNNFQEGHSGTALLMDMGCDKTLTAVAIAVALYNAKNKESFDCLSTVHCWSLARRIRKIRRF